MSDDLRVVYESHCHTPLCHHATGEPPEYVARALVRGMRGITFTCHNPMPVEYDLVNRMSESELATYVRLVREAKEAFATMDVRLGLECDYFAGYEEYVRRQIDDLDLSYVIGSVHPQLPIWMNRYMDQSDPVKTQVRYFTQLADAAETGLFDCISHPDLIKNMTPWRWAPMDARLVDAIEASLDRIARAGVAMELNTSGLLKTISEMNPGPPMLRMMCSRKIPVVVGADAHRAVRVADRFEEAYELLESVGFTHVSQFVGRKRIDVPLKQARLSLVEA